MPYELDPEESVRTGLVRCAREQLQVARHALSEQAADDPVRAIHTARKALKKERALLRLGHGAIPATQRRRENRALRDAARKLSGTRDADAMVATLDDLAEHFSGQLPASTFSAVREQLLLARDGAQAAGAGTGTASALEDLATIEARVESWKLERGDWRALDAGLLRTYRRGRKAFGRARREPTLANLHDWRKRVKDLWYELRLLSPVGGPAVRGQTQEARHLGEMLGTDHDLGVLSQTLARIDDAVAADLHPLRGLIEHRREELQSEAMFAGRRLYAEKPQAFRRRMRSCWKAGRAQARATHERHPSELAAATDSHGSY